MSCVDRVFAWRDVSHDAKEGKCEFPIQFDYVVNQENPYKFRYADNWRNQIKTVAWSGLT
jgi:hypothetical protein